MRSNKQNYYKEEKKKAWGRETSFPKLLHYVFINVQFLTKKITKLQTKYGPITGEKVNRNCT